MIFEQNQNGGFTAIPETDEDRVKLARMEKALDIFSTITETASSITALAKELPRTGKRRNIFRKTHNRRPQNTNKIRTIALRMSLAAIISSSRLFDKISRPIPKREFKSGTSQIF